MSTDPGSDGGPTGDGATGTNNDGSTNPNDSGPGGNDSGIPGHCGDPGANLCMTGDACRGAGDCASGVCDATMHCAAPSPTDGIKNGDESDIDCGGTVAPTCAVGKMCNLHADCVNDACIPAASGMGEGVCAAAKSCRQHFGGDTCGSGEVGDPAAKHEDCCLSIQPDAQPFRLDKYLITAGRMRAFIADVNGDVRTWALANRAILPVEWTTTWDASVPQTPEDVVEMLGTGQGTAAYWTTVGQANGCFVAGEGGPTYWQNADDLKNYVGDQARSYSQNDLDVKTMNCAPRAVFAAFCAWDGGRLPTYAEWAYGVRGTMAATDHLYPWGNDATIGNYASYDQNYVFPVAPLPGSPLAADGMSVDRGFQVPAPGRFPLGNGPYGHADLAGAVETFVVGDTTGAHTNEGGVRQYSFQEAGLKVEPYDTWHAWIQHISHYAVGARCARGI